MESGEVSVHFFAAARAAVGANELAMSCGSLSGILDRVADEHPEFAEVRPRCSYLVDGVAVHGDLTAIRLDPGVRVDVLPPFAGG
jgi:molybdopterin converting factor small subunit